MVVLLAHQRASDRTHGTPACVRGAGPLLTAATGGAFPVHNQEDGCVSGIPEIQDLPEILPSPAQCK